MEHARKRPFDSDRDSEVRNVKGKGRLEQGCDTEHIPAEAARDENFVIAEGTFGDIRRFVDHSVQGRTLVSKEIQLASVANLGVTANLLTFECSTLRNVVHPNIVQYFSTSMTKGERALNIIMEFTQGPTMADAIHGNVLSSEVEIVEWTRQLASALHYCHGKDVVHGDLRPENVFLTGKSKPSAVKIVGFEPPCLKTAKAKAFGVKQSVYNSPDRSSGSPYDGRDDTWALGCILLEVVTNSRQVVRCKSSQWICLNRRVVL
jgi:calcium-dependent protein kinase